jgi:serine/threonine-protein kinase HipA
MNEHQAQRALLVQLQDPSGTWVDVGTLSHANEISWFRTNPEYWQRPGRPVLGQVFEERARDWTPSQRVGIPTWFSHLLPEGRILSSVADTVGVDKKREFFLLSRLGSDDLPGAVRALPIDANDGSVLTPEETDEQVDEEENPFLKFSLAGVQAKYSVVLGDKGLAFPAKGVAGDWIVKLPDGRVGYDGVPRAEFACLELGRRAGLSVPRTLLVPVGDVDGLPASEFGAGGEAFAIERFDRKDKLGRVHAEVLAQVLDVPTANERNKYRGANFETVAAVTAGLCGPEVIDEVLDRLVLNVLVGNGDAHLKNWAFLYPDGHLPTISPLFDVVPTVLYLPKDDLGLKLNGSRAFDDVTINSFDRLAIRADVPVDGARARVRDAVTRVVEGWGVFDDFLTREQAERLTRRRDGLPLVRTA